MSILQHISFVAVSLVYTFHIVCVAIKLPGRRTPNTQVLIVSSMGALAFLLIGSSLFKEYEIFYKTATLLFVIHLVQSLYLQSGYGKSSRLHLQSKDIVV